MKWAHSVLIERTEYDEADLDEAGQPTPQTPTTTTSVANVQPRQGDEAEDYRSAGSEIGTYVIFLPLGTDVRHADAILHGDRRFNVRAVRRHDYGGLAHLELDAELVTVTEPLAVGS
jgi:SPP1 family predicted phage head-tail adaptor